MWEENMTPEQSVKQFRPATFDMEIEGLRPQFIAYIERLEKALDDLAEATLHGLVPWEFGGVFTEYEDDGNTLKSITPPWEILGGQGNTFLEALEDSMREESDNV
jgi:hypothetical protein